MTQSTGISVDFLPTPDTLNQIKATGTISSSAIQDTHPRLIIISVRSPSASIKRLYRNVNIPYLQVRHTRDLQVAAVREGLEHCTAHQQECHSLVTDTMHRRRWQDKKFFLFCFAFAQDNTHSNKEITEFAAGQSSSKGNGKILTETTTSEGEGGSRYNSYFCSRACHALPRSWLQSEFGNMFSRAVVPDSTPLLALPKL